MSFSNEYFDKEFANVPVMGIFRSLGLERSIELCTIAWDSGVESVEVPVMSQDDLDVLSAVVAAGRERGKDVGAGTIVSPELVDAVAAAGAKFTVAPGFDLDVVERCAAIGMPHLPGIATSSEIQRALRADLNWLKAFPASNLGPSWIKNQSGPFPTVNFVATGGVTSQNAEQFLDAGCRVVALGSAFAKESEITEVGRIIASRRA
ncbi:bifunctional 4-hydroxy-2-oxoglutarate aldolase/2-dehydro-3-deoxy-phosphogluconate aldolase [Humidisolicoccus flavus]|uniref:bifunctional 4-hydroxy-2-oxoglutarate aldolase/2-dehydro-3-deoxy-phosphogluconate aldolase n=1 Tax=Humidisolicoccus flavus TaxID=3111414 RepID=UPI003248276C